MLALLVLPLWVCLFARFRARWSDWRDAAMAASVGWGVAVVVITVGLSAAGAIRFWPVVLVWGGIAVVCLLKTSRLESRLAAKSGGPTVETFLLGGIALICGAVACSAIFSPPNNWDSMTYHLTRVVNWIDRGSVSHYATNNLRQLYLGPWAEYAILQLRVLSGSDRLSALVQFAAMLGSIAGVSRIAQRIGADRRGEIFAAVCCATLPMGILQGSSTQNDYVAAFWVVCFVNFALEEQPNGILCGASVGLAALTKSSALLFATPFAMWLALRGRFRAIAVMACVVAVINGPHLAQNWKMFGSPSGPATAEILNETHWPRSIVSVLVRNVAVHAQMLPSGMVESGVNRLLGFDTNDPRTTYRDTKFVVWDGFGEDYAGNPLHVLLAISAIGMCFAGGGTRRIFAGCIIAGIVLFCAALKWQPWITRLQLPGFVLASALAGAAFGRLGKAVPAIGAVLLIAASFPASLNKLRPLATDDNIFRRDSMALRFAARPELETAYVQAAAILSRSAQVGIIAKGNSWDYPLWVLAPSVKFRYTDSEETLVTLDGSRVPDGYDCVFASPSISVYRVSARR